MTSVDDDEAPGQRSCSWQPPAGSRSRPPVGLDTAREYLLESAKNSSAINRLRVASTAAFEAQRRNAIGLLQIRHPRITCSRSLDRRTSLDVATDIDPCDNHRHEHSEP